MLLLISLLSFLLPTQLAFHFRGFNSTVLGFQIDYLIPTLYLTDIAVLLIIILGFRKLKFNRKYIVFCILYIAFVATNILHSIYYIPALYKWIRVSEMIALGLIIKNTKSLDVFKHFIVPLSYSMFIVCLLGIFQYFNNGSIGGLFYFLGERAYQFSSPDVAPYPYSTFSHSNSFAGFLLVFSIYLLQFKNKFKLKYFLTLLILVGTNLILTNSLNVYLVIVILLIIKLKQNLVFSFLFVNFSDRYIAHRIELVDASIKIIKSNFLLGVGLNNFIPNLAKVSNNFISSWELQPVHNIFLLIFSETGIIGLSAFCFMLYGVFTVYNLPLIAILITGLSDHYWITLQQNMLLFTYVLALSKRR